MDIRTPQDEPQRVPPSLIIRRQLILEHYVSTVYLRGGGKNKKKKKKGSQALNQASNQIASYNPQNAAFYPPSNPPNPPVYKYSKPSSKKPNPILSHPVVNPPNPPVYPFNPSNPLLSLRSNLQNITHPSQNSQSPLNVPSQTPTVYHTHTGLFTRLLKGMKLRDKDQPNRAASWRCGSQKHHNGVYGWARATKMNKKEKRISAGPIGLAINRNKLTNNMLQRYGEQLPGREVDFTGKFKLEDGKKLWYVPLNREEAEESESGSESD